MLTEEQFDQVFSIMEEAFPEIEYRNYESQKKLLSNPYYKIKTVAKGNTILGFLAYWDLPTCCFGEHLAITPELRGKNIGGHLLKTIMKNLDKPLVLEVELPNADISKRRIEFYQRLGFVYNDFPYLQQPLRPEMDVLPLSIMTYPQGISSGKFVPLKKDIYKEVYNIPKI